MRHLSQQHSSLLWRIALAFLAASALTAVLAATTADPDLWGHLRFGLDTLRDGAIAQVDPYSYATAGERWINHEWLAELLFALAWTVAGCAGLVALKLAVGWATCGLLYRHLVKLPLDPARAAILLTLLALPLLTVYFLLLRPQVFTYLCFTLTLLAIRRADSGDYRALWIAPIVLVAWTNLHGGVLAGIGMLGLWACLHLLQRPQAFRHVFAPALASLAALLCSPYGVDLPLFLLRTATVPRPEILEWQPITLPSLYGALYAGVLLTALFGISLGRPQRRHSTQFALLALTAILPLLSVRHLPLFSIAATVFAGECVAAAWMRAAGTATPDAAASVRPAAALLPVAAALMLLSIAFQRGFFTQVRANDGFRVPAGAVELLRRSEVSGKLMIDFAWGEYAIWHLGPRVQVGMDGRRETIYPTAVYEQYLDFHRGIHDWDAILKEHPADFVLVGTESPCRSLMKLEHGWSLVLEDSVGALFVRDASPQAPAVRHAAKEFTPSNGPQSFP